MPDLTDLDRLREQATQGHWERGGPYPSVTVIVCVDGGCGWPSPEPPAYEPIAYLHQGGPDFDKPPPPQAVADALYIAALHNAYPAMRDELLAAREKIKAYEERDKRLVTKWRREASELYDELKHQGDCTQRGIAEGLDQAADELHELRALGQEGGEGR